MDLWTLAVEIGDSCTVAAARRRDQVQVVEFGQRSSLPSAVFFAGHGPPVAGVEAAERAAAEPDHAVRAPRRALNTASTVTVAGTEAPLAEVYAALLRAVAGHAAAGQQTAGPDRLILLHQAGWGERELGVLTAAAASAGLPAPEFALGPVTTAWHLAAATPAGRAVAVMDLRDDRAEPAVLWRTADSFRLADTQGGAVSLAAEQLAVPLREGSYELLAAITRAGLTPSQLSAAYVVGPPDRSSVAAELMTEVLGVTPQVAADPDTAGVRGALETTRSGKSPAASGPRRPVLTSWRRRIIVATTALATIAAAVVIASQFASSAEPTVPRVFIINGKPDQVPQLIEINPETRAILRRITLAAGIDAMVPAPDGARAYLIGETPGPGRTITSFVTSFDMATGRVGRPITVPGDLQTLLFAVGGPAAYALTTLQHSDAVVPINTAANTRGRPILVPGEADVMAITPNGKTIYVTDPRSFTTGQFGLVTPVNTTTGKTEPPITVGLNPSDIAITPNGKTAYVVNTNSGTVTPINVASSTAGKPIPVGSPGEVALSITISPDGKMAYVVSNPPGAEAISSLTPLDTATDYTTPPMTIQGDFATVVIAPNSRTAYALTNSFTQNGDGAVTPLDLPSRSADPYILVGDPDDMILSPDAKHLYITGRPGENENSTTIVTEVSTATHAAQQIISVTGSIYATVAADVRR